MLGADYYETDAEIASQLAEGKVPLGIGENTRIKYITKMFFLLYLSSEKMNVILISFLTLFQLICRDCIIDKNARIGKNVVIANSEVRSSHTPNNSKISNFIFLLLGLTYFPLIHQFAGCTRSRQIFRRILHPIRHHNHIEELNNPRWNCHMTSVAMSFFSFK